MLAILFGLGHWEIVIFLAVALLIFGSRLPKTLYHLGSSIVSFKKGYKETEKELKELEDTLDGKT